MMCLKLQKNFAGVIKCFDGVVVGRSIVEARWGMYARKTGFIPSWPTHSAVERRLSAVVLLQGKPIQAVTRGVKGRM